MPVAGRGPIEIDDAVWDLKEHDWTGKSFYFIQTFNIFYKVLSLGSKLEELNREAHRSGYKILNNRVLIQYAPFKGRVMVEVEKQEKYDANVLTYDIQTSADTSVYRGDLLKIAKGFKRLRERVYSRRAMNPRELYYVYIPGSGQIKTILFAVT